jgi:hypothetical protein
MGSIEKLSTFQKEYLLIKDSNNIVNTATGMRNRQVRNCDSIPSRSKRYFSSPSVYTTIWANLAILQVTKTPSNLCQG